MKGYFVTGTGTGVGKTTVGAALLAAATAAGRRARACKPVESGCGDPAIPADAELLRRAAGGAQRLDEVVAITLVEPLAPAVAARRIGRTLRLAELVAAVRRVAATSPDVLLVEGAGGLLVPVAEDATVAELAGALGLPLLVVGRADLGTINHTSMTLECALNRGLAVAGVVLSEPGGSTTPQALAENRAAIERQSGVPVLGVLPHLPGLDDSDASLARLAAAARAALPLHLLL